MEDYKVKWEGSKDDFTASLGGYKLRIKKINDKLFWWNVLFKNKVVDSIFFSKSEHPKTLEKAKDMCLIAMFDHEFNNIEK